MMGQSKPGLVAVIASLSALVAFPSGASAVALSWSAPIPLTGAGGAITLTSVACPAASQCTAVTVKGEEITFDPAAPGAPAIAQIDPGAYVTAVACPSVSQCTAVDRGGQEVTFDPTASGSPTPAGIDPREFIESLACPSASLCVEVDAGSSEVTFNPTAAGSASSATIDAGGEALYGLACPAAGECAAVDRLGGVITFDPAALGMPQTIGVDPVDGLTEPDGIACPSPSQCTMVDTGGTEVTFDPMLPALATATSIDPGRAITAVTCPSASECVFVDRAGRAIIGNPANPRGWTLDPVAASVALTAVACASVAVCVAVDGVGDAFVGRSAPVDVSPPSISGQTAPGQLLTEAPGGWLGDPTGYTYQWQRCDAAGLTCTAIAGATGQAYTLVGADAGSTIRVQETASNAIGESGAATSAPTAVISAPSSGGGGGSPPISPSPPGAPKITGYRVTGNGTTFRYTLSEPATVRLMVSQRLPGRKRGKRCLAPSAKLLRAMACTLLIARVTLTHASAAGANTIAIRSLPPARYQATITATNSSGQKSKAVTVVFTVVARAG
jgi:hypothetical protein